MNSLRPDTDQIALRLFVRVWVPFASGYFISYFYRTINAVISPDLVRDLGVSPAELGLLTSAYFITFAMTQLPLGLALDRFGPRRVNVALLLFAAAGAALFGVAKSLPGLILARALIGFGVSACMMSSIKAFVQWFPMSRLAMVNGCLLAMGGVGAMVASVPVEAALKLTDWRGIFFAVAVATLGVASLVFFAVPERRDAGTREDLAQLLEGTRIVFRDGFFWRMCFVSTFVTGTMMSLQGLWAAPWLRDLGGFSRVEVGEMLMGMAFATTIGFAGLGFLADRLAKAGFDPLRLYRIAVLVSMASFLMIILDLGGGRTVATVAIWSLYAMFGTGSTLSYPILSRHFPPHLAGRVNTAANMLLFVGAFSIQWGIGAVINLWPVSASGQYAIAGYQAAFGIALALQALAVWVLGRGEKAGARR